MYVVTFDRAGRAGTEIEIFGSVSIPHVTYNASSLRSLSYPNKTSKDYSDFQDGFVDLPVIVFSKQHPEYEFIWAIEDDVAFTGDFGLLIERLSATNSGAGLACTHVRMLPAYWEYTHLFQSGSDTLPAEMPHRLCFLPFYGVTRHALGAIDAAYRRGWSGHNEMLWTMILDYSGIRVRDIGGAGPFVNAEDVGQCYVDESPLPDDFRKLGSFGTMNIRLFPGRRENILWHPVKTPRNFIRMRIRRGKSIAQWYRNKIGQRFASFSLFMSRG